jgi:hypothetical protein
MSPRKPLFTISLIILILCLAAGYGIAGKWLGALLAILIGPAWLLSRKNTEPWLPFLCLLASVGLAVAGRLSGAPYVLMIFCSALSLAVWDLMCLDTALGGSALGAQTRRYENKHFQSLALALGFGLIVALLGHLITLRLPLIVLMLLIAFTLFGLDRVWGSIKRTGQV